MQNFEGFPLNLKCRGSCNNLSTKANNSFKNDPAKLQ